MTSPENKKEQVPEPTLSEKKQKAFQSVIDRGQLTDSVKESLEKLADERLKTNPDESETDFLRFLEEEIQKKLAELQQKPTPVSSGEVKPENISRPLPRLPEEPSSSGSEIPRITFDNTSLTFDGKTYKFQEDDIGGLIVDKVVKSKRTDSVFIRLQLPLNEIPSHIQSDEFAMKKLKTANSLRGIKDEQSQLFLIDFRQDQISQLLNKEPKDVLNLWLQNQKDQENNTNKVSDSFKEKGEEIKNEVEMARKAYLEALSQDQKSITWLNRTKKYFSSFIYPFAKKKGMESDPTELGSDVAKARTEYDEVLDQHFKSIKEWLEIKYLNKEDPRIAQIMERYIRRYKIVDAVQKEETDLSLARLSILENESLKGRFLKNIRSLPKGVKIVGGTFVVAGGVAGGVALMGGLGTALLAGRFALQAGASYAGLRASAKTGLSAGVAGSFGFMRGGADLATAGVGGLLGGLGAKKGTEYVLKKVMGVKNINSEFYKQKETQYSQLFNDLNQIQQTIKVNQQKIEAKNLSIKRKEDPGGTLTKEVEQIEKSNAKLLDQAKEIEKSLVNIKKNLDNSILEITQQLAKGDISPSEYIRLRQDLETLEREKKAFIAKWSTVTGILAGFGTGYGLMAFGAGESIQDFLAGDSTQDNNPHASSPYNKSTGPDLKGKDLNSDVIRPPFFVKEVSVSEEPLIRPPFVAKEVFPSEKPFSMLMDGKDQVNSPDSSSVANNPDPASSADTQSQGLKSGTTTRDSVAGQNKVSNTDSLAQQKDSLNAGSQNINATNADSTPSQEVKTSGSSSENSDPASSAKTINKVVSSSPERANDWSELPASSQVEKGDGVTHIFKRQLDNDPELKASAEKALGMKYEDNKGYFLSRLAYKFGYISEDGTADVRLNLNPNNAYHLHVDNKGELVVDEWHDKALNETKRLGDAFETKTDDGIDKPHEYLNKEKSVSGLGKNADRPDFTFKDAKDSNDRPDFTFKDAKDSSDRPDFTFKDASSSRFGDNADIRVGNQYVPASKFFGAEDVTLREPIQGEELRNAVDKMRQGYGFQKKDGEFIFENEQYRGGVPLSRIMNMPAREMLEYVTGNDTNIQNLNNKNEKILADYLQEIYRQTEARLAEFGYAKDNWKTWPDTVTFTDMEALAAGGSPEVIMNKLSSSIPEVNPDVAPLPETTSEPSPEPEAKPRKSTDNDDLYYSGDDDDDVADSAEENLSTEKSRPDRGATADYINYKNSEIVNILNTTEKLTPEQTQGFVNFLQKRIPENTFNQYLALRGDVFMQPLPYPANDPNQYDGALFQMIADKIMKSSEVALDPSKTMAENFNRVFERLDATTRFTVPSTPNLTPSSIASL